MHDTSVGVYVHVPFCGRICPYCDFAVVRAPRLAPADEDAYVDALLCELGARARDFAGLALETLYFGGGTPSLLRPASIARLERAVQATFAGASAQCETTLEVNPSTLERARLPGFREAGISRLSLGLQSFDDTVLRRLGRAHRGEEGEASFAAARAAGFDNLSVDLIFAAPGQSVEGVGRDLLRVVALAPEHVSTYALTIEDGTPFALAERRGQLQLAGEDEAVRMMEEVEAQLGAAGLTRYEISSFAREGFASRHNRRYWERRPVLGLGMGAWSIDPRSGDAPFGARRANLRDLNAYLSAVAARGRAEDGPPERLDEATARGEAVFLALRTLRGLDGEAFAQEFGAAPRAFYAEAIDALRQAGWLEEDPLGGLRLTPRGRLVSDSVFAHFV